MENKKKRKLLHWQCWPNKHSISATFWAPNGERLELEADLPYKVWKDIINKIVKYIKQGNSTK